MNLIKPYFEVLPQPMDILDVYKQVEHAGRTCYKSHDKITQDSAQKFVDMLIGRGHTAALESGTVYLCVDADYKPGVVQRYENNKYSITNPSPQDGLFYITTNLRVIHENGWYGDLEHWSGLTAHHEPRITVRFVCDRGVSHELVRHRAMSFMQESTRYCNYAKSDSIDYIAPEWIHNLQHGQHDSCALVSQYRSIPPQQEFLSEELKELVWLNSVATSELNYLELIKNGWKPEQARSILPNTLKTEIVVTGFLFDWLGGVKLYESCMEQGRTTYKCIGSIPEKEYEFRKADYDSKYVIYKWGFFPLRAATPAHPQMKQLAYPLKDEFIKLGFYNRDYNLYAQKA